MTCPVCRTKLASSQIYPNRLQNRQILSLKIRCDRHRRGCEWTGELRLRDNHNAVCPYVRVPCERVCGKLVMRKDAVEHNEKCCKRTVECEHCNHSVQLRYLKNHFRKCWEMPLACASCAIVLSRKEMRVHAQKCHAGTTTKCTFSEFGCQFEGNKETVARHMASEVEVHLGALMETVKKQKYIITKEKESHFKQMVSMKYQIDQAASKINDQQSELAALKQQVSSLSQQLNMVTRLSGMPPPVTIIPPHHHHHHHHLRPPYHPVVQVPPHRSHQSHGCHQRRHGCPF